MHTPRRIACLLYPELMSLDLVGPMQVFASANAERKGHGLPPAYVLQLVGATAGPVLTSAGFALTADTARDELALAGLDTLLVPGGDGVDAQLGDGSLLAWLRAVEPQVRRLGSVCSGALLLAAAGLLDGHRATTHWSRTETLRRRHPAVRIEPDCLHTYDSTSPQDSHLFTSAGVTAGIDLALALVEADLGRPLALAVARRLVMFMRRPGGQAQFSHLLAPEALHAPRLAALLEWIPGQIGSDLSLQAMADRACMPPRTLSRVFQRELGMAPGRYVERVRVEAASALLAQAQASIATVARLCGFAHPENLRRSFHKHRAVSPQAYAERFGTAPRAD
ncbi:MULTISPECIES: helix-turn-helix domain-containing protein [unclassified Variovorax]|uniref:GlxA family transcriptional regulator n=1 Tax=unclassified Variovorax TaxID=663243 RepID=UPI0025758A92|nr:MULTISPECIES: helix-turn-helix domain-containing protein [unclassified Variovorax]MDM0086826.1 DJ-1/PfpI family protein [Variovorax sp. J22G40]MDM0144918.1 DJ-1/PfpI family protein [Variovorax sp. J2P1-31]